MGSKIAQTNTVTDFRNVQGATLTIYITNSKTYTLIAQSAWFEEYTDCISAEE